MFLSGLDPLQQTQELDCDSPESPQASYAAGSLLTDCRGVLLSAGEADLHVVDRSSGASPTRSCLTFATKSKGGKSGILKGAAMPGWTCIAESGSAGHAAAGNPSV